MFWEVKLDSFPALFLFTLQKILQKYPQLFINLTAKAPQTNPNFSLKKRIFT
jgi:hypothetical protein